MGAASPNQMFRRGYRLISIDRYRQGVRCTSPPYLVTLRHPTPLSLRSGMPNEDMKMDGRQRGKEENGKRCKGAPNLSCHLFKPESHAVRGSDIIEGWMSVCEIVCVHPLTEHNTVRRRTHQHCNVHKCSPRTFNRVVL